MPLSAAPESVADSSGRPRFGTYRGSLPRIDLSALSGPYRVPFPLTPFKHKRWVYSFVATPEVLALFSVVDLSYTASAFVLVADLIERKVLIDESFVGLPGPLAQVNDAPGAGLRASFRGPTSRLKLARPEGAERYEMDVEHRRLLPYPRTELSWKGDVLAVGGAPALTVISPVSGDGVVNVTQKWAGLLSFGTLFAAGRRFVLDGGVGGIDYSQGYLARHTRWRWAFANGRLQDGTPIGINLVEGFNDLSDEANENALWLGKELIPLSRARFEYQKEDPLRPWRVTTEKGEVSLEFQPLGVHREVRDYKLVRSRFLQPVGLFEGTVKVGSQTHTLTAMPGVTEDQDILW